MKPIGRASRAWPRLALTAVYGAQACQLPIWSCAVAEMAGLQTNDIRGTGIWLLIDQVLPRWMLACIQQGHALLQNPSIWPTRAIWITYHVPANGHFGGLSNHSKSWPSLDSGWQPVIESQHWHSFLACLLFGLISQHRTPYERFGTTTSAALLLFLYNTFTSFDLRPLLNDCHHECSPPSSRDIP